MSEAHPIVSRATYVTIFVVLICLTALTAGVANIDLGWLNTPIAVAIAATKASLVVLFFMHLRYGGKLERMAAFCAIAFLAILILVTMDDVLTRGTKTYLQDSSLSSAMSAGPGTAASSGSPK